MKKYIQNGKKLIKLLSISFSPLNYVKGLCCINIRVCFFLYQAKNENERQTCIGQRHENKYVQKTLIHTHFINVCIKHHGSLICANKHCFGKNKVTSLNINT
jgi:hypothetical protein